MIKQIFGCIVIIFSLTACSNLAEKPATGDVNQITSWEIRGKAMLMSQKQKGSARLFWQQKGNDFNISLTSQVGTHILTLSQKGDTAQLTDAQHAVYTAQDAQTLLKIRSPWYFPVDNLKTWVKGIPGENPHKRNEKGDLSSLVAGNWLVDFTDYKNFANYRLPTRITINGYDSQIRMVIQEWNLD